MFCSRNLLLILLSGLLLGRVGWAQPPPAKAKLDDCYRIVGKDSVVFFYSADYVLTPPGCATIRRHVQLDSAGRFRGYVRDFLLANNVPLLRGAYRNGLLEGLVEVYHTTGELAARGHYRQGAQVGDWGYWYASGSRRQILSFRDGQDPLIQQFWDEAGQQLVTDGNGNWYREQTGLRLQGTVVAGRPDGRWLTRQVRDNSVVSRENFVQGRFRSGLLIETLEAYHDQSHLNLADWEEYLRAEKYQLGAACLSGQLGAGTPPTQP